MRKAFYLFILVILVASSCRKDFDTISNYGSLTFSKDTVYLDTVFTNIGSSTYNLKVYNKSNKNIHIPTIKLGRGNNSKYRISVDGLTGITFNDIPILAKDSIYIFIETTIDYDQVTNPIYTDSIVFDNGNQLQDVDLVTLVKDAHFLYPSKNTEGIIESIKLGTNSDGEAININGFYLSENTTFTNEKPYIIYGYCAVKEDNTLTIEEGAKIHFHSNSGLIVDKNATLNINGTLNKEVVFEGDRLEPSFSDIPGQWGTIWLRAGSKNNTIDYAIIKNSSIGIITDSINGTSPTLTIKNSQIYNSSNYGLLGRETNIKGENLVINNSGFSSLACTIGGTYNFTHATFTNYWSSSLRQYPTVLINNYFSYGAVDMIITESRDLKEANFTNCIIYGSSNIEMILDKAEDALFNYNFKNNLIRFDDFNNQYSGILEYNFEDETHFQNNLFNLEPDFKNPYENMLIIGDDSDANNKADLNSALDVPLDILGVNRTTSPDIGAYQHITFD